MARLLSGENRALRSTEPKIKVVSRNVGNRVTHLTIDLETEVLRVESDGTVNVIDEIPDCCDFP